MEHLLSTPKAAKILGMSSRRLNYLAHQGRIGKRMPGFRNWVFTPEEIEEFKKIERKAGNPRARTLPRLDNGKWARAEAMEPNAIHSETAPADHSSSTPR